CFFKQVSAARYDFEPARHAHFRSSLAITLEHNGIAATDNQQRRGVDMRQPPARKIRTATAGHDGLYSLRMLCSGYKSRRCAGAGAEISEMEFSCSRLSFDPVCHER